MAQIPGRPTKTKGNVDRDSVDFIDYPELHGGVGMVRIKFSSTEELYLLLTAIRRA